MHFAFAFILQFTSWETSISRGNKLIHFRIRYCQNDVKILLFSKVLCFEIKHLEQKVGGFSKQLKLLWFSQKVKYAQNMMPAGIMYSKVKLLKKKVYRNVSTLGLKAVLRRGPILHHEWCLWKRQCVLQIILVPSKPESKNLK